jgi:hypothetical protein
VYWPAMRPVLEMNVQTFVSWSLCFSTMVPGTTAGVRWEGIMRVAGEDDGSWAWEKYVLQMLSSLASAQYASRYFWYSAQRGMNFGSSGSQLVRWYSGSTARSLPCDAASLMNDTAFAWFVSIARGCWDQ